jgi:hypothetical protein
MTRCDRCYRETRAHIMSMFNEDVLCLDCKKKEEQHPDYERARRIEGEAVRSGQYNFPGVGKPSDL